MHKVRHRVFISYSHKDREFLKALQVHLHPLEREGRITRWDDTLIQSGAKWKMEIKNAIEEARIAILLVSKHFLASDFIAENELPPLLQAAEADGAIVLPVLLSPCRFSRTAVLSDYQAVNSPDKTLIEMSGAEQDRTWLDLTYRIEDILSSPITQPTKKHEDHALPITPAAPTPPRTIAISNRGWPDRSPDLYMLVSQDIVANHVALSFQLKARDGSLGLDDRLYGPTILASDPKIYFGELFRDIENLSTATETDRNIARIKLESKGTFLFESLIPVDLADVLWSLQGKVETLLIQSDEGIIPWELFKLIKRHERAIEQGPFLCEAFALTRWISGHEPSVELNFNNVAWISPQDSRMLLHGDHPDQLIAAGVEVNMIPANFLGVHDALASGKFDVLHFSTHSSHAHGNPSQWRLYLEDQQGLTPEDLVGLAANLGKAKPLVFLNACQTGLNAETITGVSGWAMQFIKAGAGAFIGAYWNLEDSAASAFQESLYKHFLAGLTIGESVRRARMLLKDSGNPTWLAYTAYAHPEAQLVSTALRSPAIGNSDEGRVGGERGGL